MREYALLSTGRAVSVEAQPSMGPCVGWDSTRPLAPSHTIEVEVLGEVCHQEKTLAGVAYQHPLQDLRLGHANDGVFGTHCRLRPAPQTLAGTAPSKRTSTTSAGETTPLALRTPSQASSRARGGLWPMLGNMDESI